MHKRDAIRDELNEVRSVLGSISPKTSLFKDLVRREAELAKRLKETME